MVMQTFLYATGTPMVVMAAALVRREPFCAMQSLTVLQYAKSVIFLPLFLFL